MSAELCQHHVTVTGGMKLKCERPRPCPEHDATYELPTADVPFNSLEIGYLMGAGYHTQWGRKGGWMERCKDPGERTARSIYRKLKAAAIKLGVEWYYGDPWDMSKDEKK